MTVTMWCFRYRKLLIPYSEGALEERAARSVERHIASCPNCARDLDDIRSVSGALCAAAAPAMEPAPDLWSRVSARIADEEAPARRPPLRLPRAVSAFAGAALIAVMGLYIMRTDFGAVSPSVDRKPARVTSGARDRGQTPSRRTMEPVTEQTPRPGKPEPVPARAPESAGPTTAPVAAAVSKAKAPSAGTAAVASRPLAPAPEVRRPAADSPKAQAGYNVRALGHSHFSFPSEDEGAAGAGMVSAEECVPAASPPAARVSTNGGLAVARAPEFDGAVRSVSPDVARARGMDVTATAGSPSESVVDILNETEGVRAAALFTYP